MRDTERKKTRVYVGPGDGYCLRALGVNLLVVRKMGRESRLGAMDLRLSGEGGTGFQNMRLVVHIDTLIRGGLGRRLIGDLRGKVLCSKIDQGIGK